MTTSLASLFIASAALVAVGIPLVWLLARVLKLAPQLPPSTIRGGRPASRSS